MRKLKDTSKLSEQLEGSGNMWLVSYCVADHYDGYLVRKDEDDSWGFSREMHILMGHFRTDDSTPDPSQTGDVWCLPFDFIEGGHLCG
jgi:hypothetical protein